MSVNVTLNNTIYTIPQTDETGWGNSVTSWIQAVSSSTLQLSGGSFTLSAEVDFGSSFGLKSLYYKSRGTNPASAGILRLANTENISWRNAANNADVTLAVTALDKLAWNNVELATISGTQQLTNKDYDGGTASNTSRLTVPKNTITNLQGLTRKEGTLAYASDLNKLYADDGSTLIEVGSGSGVTNYITNSDFESNVTTGWNLLTATITSGVPTGAPTVGSAASITTFTTTNTNPLQGSYSLQTASSGAWAQGAGVISDALTLNREDQAKVLFISGYYEVVSGASNANFSGTSSNTYAVYIYDVTNSAWVQPAGVYAINQSSGSGRFIATFQTASNLASFRVAIVAVNASSGAITVNWDSLVCGPQSYLYGAPVTDWVAFTPSLAGMSLSTNTGFYRRVGDSVEIQVYAVSSSTVSTTIALTIPASLTIDTTKVNTGTQCLGVALANDVSGNAVTATAVYASSTTLQFWATSAAGVFGAASPFTWASGDKLSIHAFVPVSGWSSTVQMSSDSDTRVVAALYETGSALSITNNSATTGQFACATKIFDTNSAYNTSTAIYTVQVPGIYKASASLRFSGSAAWAVGEVITLQLFKNGSLSRNLSTTYIMETAAISPAADGSCYVSCNAGDTLEVRVFQNSGSSQTLDGVSAENWTSYERISGPSVLAATDTVAARYTLSGNQSIPNSTATKVTFDTKTFDSVTSISSGTWTAPISGTYSVKCLIQWAGSSAGTRNVTVYRSGVEYASVGFDAAPVAAQPNYVGGATLVKLLAGQTIEIYAFQDSGGALNVSSTYSNVEIFRVGNY